MANYNTLINNFRQKLQQNSVSWGSLALWIFALIVILTMVTKFANA